LDGHGVPVEELVDDEGERLAQQLGQLDVAQLHGAFEHLAKLDERRLVDAVRVDHKIRHIGRHYTVRVFNPMVPVLAFVLFVFLALLVFCMHLDRTGWKDYWDR
jgi:hypothetical protein